MINSFEVIKILKYITWFNKKESKNINLTGGKGASLAKMYQELSKELNIPNGFVLTTEAYNEFISKNNLKEKINNILKKLDTQNFNNLAKIGKQIRELIIYSQLPKEIEEQAIEAIKELGEKSVAVRSSATAEDLPNASFAGMHSSFLNVWNPGAISNKIKACYYSLYSNRAIRYRVEKGIKGNISMAIVVQEMVNADVSGVAFTTDPESGFKDVVIIESTFGLGETIVKGKTDPDKYIVYKPKLLEGKKPIIERKIGNKTIKTILDRDLRTKESKTSEKEKNSFTLNDNKILELAKLTTIIEKHYNKPMDIEFAIENNKISILQARPLTGIKNFKVEKVKYILEEKGKPILEGLAIGGKIGSGKVKIIKNKEDFSKLEKGDVLVTEMTDPDWMEIMMKASAIVTNKGGTASHSAIVSRELGIPCIVGTKNSTEILKEDQIVTISCAEGDKGYVYHGQLDFSLKKEEYKVNKTKTNVMMIVNFSDAAFHYGKYPSDGVGMVRGETLILENVGIHPKALVEYKKLKDEKLINLIKEKTKGYTSPKEYFVDKLALALGKIGAAFYPRKVILKLTDFKSNEYKNVSGGDIYEPNETNPMIGWRSAVRFYSPKYKPIFKLECEAIRKVRDEMGIDNIQPMVPYCRTIEEGKTVINTMKEAGLVQGKNNLKIIGEVEVPALVIQLDEYSKIFDDYMIGISCLTQSTLCLDKDNPLTQHLWDERHPAVKHMISTAVKKAHKQGKKIGALGQAASNYPDFIKFLVKEGVDSISINPDPETFIKMREEIEKIEEKIK